MRSFFSGAVLGDEFVKSGVTSRGGRNGDLGESAAIAGKLPPGGAVLGPFAFALGSTNDLDAAVEGSTLGDFVLGLLADEIGFNVRS